MTNHATSPSDPLARTRRKVLVVDDDDIALRLFVRALARGYDVDCAVNGNEARAFLETRCYDTVVSDVSLPDLDGIQLLKMTHERDPDLPIVLVTGAPHVNSAIEAVDYGAFRYLVKPVRPTQLREVVGQAVQRRDLARFRDEAVALFREANRQQSDRSVLEGHFELALDEIYMLYQPIVNVRDRSVFAHEALMRSHSRDLSHPLALLDAAEALGQVWKLGRAVRARVAHELSLAPHQQTVFVNLHPDELLDEELYHESASLSRFANRIVLEITERSRLTNLQDLEGRVAQLRRLGYRLAIDDLGSGYAGLSSVVSLEPVFVKIDMCLVRDIESKPKTQRLLQSILDLGNQIGLEVILEGVETRDEADTLVGMGAQLLQGYLFGRPAPLGHPSAPSPDPAGRIAVVGSR